MNKKREPHSIEVKIPDKITEVEVVLPQGRYLGELTTDPQANIGDYYRNKGSSRERLLTRQGRKST